MEGVSDHGNRDSCYLFVLLLVSLGISMQENVPPMPECSGEK